MRLRAQAARLLLVAGCSGSSGGVGDAGLPADAVTDAPMLDTVPDISPDAGLTPFGCDPAVRVGSFRVDLTESYTGVQGQVFDRVRPITVLETVTGQGPCRIARTPNYVCAPPCPIGESCDAEGACVPNPVAHTVGTVTVSGLLAPVEMNPLPPAQFYTNSSPLPHPGFSPGVEIALAAAGGDYQPFELFGFGITALEIAASEIAVEPGMPVALEWTAPPPGPTRLRVLLNVNPHGGPGSVLECEVADTGAFSIPAALVTALIEDGLSGFPRITLNRTTADTVEITPGCVEFRVQSQRLIPVTVPGLISCDGNEDCTPPETCQTNLTCG